MTELAGRIQKLRDGYADQAKFADHEPAAYFRDFVKRLNVALLTPDEIPATVHKAFEVSNQAYMDLKAAIGGSYELPDGRSFWVDEATVREIMTRITPIIGAECERHRLAGEHLHKPKETASA